MRWERFELEKSPWGVDRALQAIVRVAYERTSGYPRLLKDARRAVSAVRVLDGLPIVDKETLFRRFATSDVLRSGVKLNHCIRTGTSGSTGLPLNVYMSRTEALFRRVLLFRAWRRLSHLPWPLRVADVGGWVEAESKAGVRTGPWGQVVRISIALPAEEQVHLLERCRPSVLSGYPTAISVLAEAFRRVAGRVSTLMLIATRGEILHADTRSLLEETFACRVADFYNSEEIGNIAWECPDDPSSMHVNTDACVLEIVDEKGMPLPSGSEGRIIVTNLYNRTMPFVRYDLHDRGTMLLPGEGRCSCGSQAPKIAVLQGRDDDYVCLPDGRRVSPRLIATGVNRAFDGLSPQGGIDRHFRRFQVVQDAPDHLTIRVIPEPGRSHDFRSVIEPMLRRIHGDLKCSVEIVEELPLDSSGKFKKVIRNLASEQPEL